jgi:hypothetical protein
MRCPWRSSTARSFVCCRRSRDRSFAASTRATSPAPRSKSRRAERALDRYYGASEAGELEATRLQARVAALEARLTDLREQDEWTIVD